MFAGPEDFGPGGSGALRRTPENPATLADRLARRPLARVLLVAEAATPEGAGAPRAAWSLARALADVAEVHLATHKRNRGPLAAAGLTEGRDFTAIDSGTAVAWMARLVQGSGDWRGRLGEVTVALTHPGFERAVWRSLGSRIVRGDFDIVHRIAPRSPLIGGPLARHCARAGVPFLLGPVNGGTDWPAAVASAAWGAGALLRLLPGWRQTTPRDATAVLAGTRGAEAGLAALTGGQVIWVPDDGVDPQLFHGQADPPPGPLRLCLIGRLDRDRGADLLIEAAAPLLRVRRVRIDVIGDGPLRQALAAQVRREGGEAGVRFHGWLSQPDLRDIAVQAAVIVSPTLRGSGGSALLEGMALGLAPVVLDHAAPGEIVTEGVGFKVPLGDRAAMVAGLRRVLDELADDPDGVAAVAGSARARVRTHFTWAAKARQVGYVYDWLRGIRSTPPVFYSQSQPILSYLPVEGATEGDGDGLG